MKRLALIFHVPNGKDQDELSTDYDAENWTNYLQSKSGGGWRSSEIEVYRNPTQRDVATLWSLAKAKLPDFGLVVFSGHGEIWEDAYGRREDHFYCYDAKTIVVQNLAISKLRNLIVTDTCRNVVMRIDESIEKSYGLGDVGYFSGQNEANIPQIRAAYELAIQKCELGTIVAHSCSEDESSGDTGHGGLYTQILLTEANDISENLSFGQYANVRAVHNRASKKVFRASREEQLPELNGGRRLNYFPFAMGYKLKTIYG